MPETYALRDVSHACHVRPRERRSQPAVLSSQSGVAHVRLRPPALSDANVARRHTARLDLPALFHPPSRSNWRPWFRTIDQTAYLGGPRTETQILARHHR